MAEVMGTVKWLEVALYMEATGDKSGISTPGVMSDGLGGFTYANASTMRYIGTGRPS